MFSFLLTDCDYHRGYSGTLTYCNMYDKLFCLVLLKSHNLFVQPACLGDPAVYSSVIVLEGAVILTLEPVSVDPVPRGSPGLVAGKRSLHGEDLAVR